MVISWELMECNGDSTGFHGDFLLIYWEFMGNNIIASIFETETEIMVFHNQHLLMFWILRTYQYLELPHFFRMNFQLMKIRTRFDHELSSPCFFPDAVLVSLHVIMFPHEFHEF